jgi:hypothetical protein
MPDIKPTRITLVIVLYLSSRICKMSGPSNKRISDRKTTEEKVSKAIAALRDLLEGLVALGARSRSRYDEMLTNASIFRIVHEMHTEKRTRKEGKHVWQGSSHPEWDVELRTCQQGEQKTRRTTETKDCASEKTNAQSIDTSEYQTD